MWCCVSRAAVEFGATTVGPVFPFGFEMGFFAVESEAAKLSDPGMRSRVAGWRTCTVCVWLVLYVRPVKRPCCVGGCRPRGSGRLALWLPIGRERESERKKDFEVESRSSRGPAELMRMFPWYNILGVYAPQYATDAVVEFIGLRLRGRNHTATLRTGGAEQTTAVPGAP